MKLENQTFDLFRLTKSKREVDLAPNTVRAYVADGLTLYRVGRACFVSRSELASFIRHRGAKSNR